MREIMFRAKIKNWEERSKENQWVEGYYCKRKSGHYTDIGYEEEYKECIIKEFSDGGTTFCDVDPETVCQYTGLTDKNGKKIFEGDILSGKKYCDWGQGGEYEPDKCIIEWNEEHAAFDPVYWWEGYNHDLKHYEVVGNIFDNPELIDTAGI